MFASRSGTIRLLYLFFLLLVVVLLGADAVFRRLAIRNSALSKVRIYWIHPTTREKYLVTAADLSPGKEEIFNSHAGHEFQVEEEPYLSSLELDNNCNASKTASPLSSDGTSRSCTFHVPEYMDPFVVVTEDIECVMKQDRRVSARQEANEMIGMCLEDVYSGMQTETNRRTWNITQHNIQIINQMVECMREIATDRLVQSNEELTLERTISHNISKQAEKYFCLDDSLETTPPEYETSWEYIATGAVHNVTTKYQYKVQIHHERNASKIHLLPNFASIEECQAMINAAQDSLEKARVFDGKGGSAFNGHRKASQGIVKYYMDDEDQTLPNIVDRIYSYTNHVMHLNLSFVGQEFLNMIEYTGRGINDEEPDQYKPHCDGYCDGRRHTTGLRVATFLIYCKVPERGGHTHFGNAGVHIKPRVGDALFFSYLNPNSLIHERNEFTQHSGCPVFEGTKQLVTQWMRLGVSRERPYYHYNTLGQYIDPDRTNRRIATTTPRAKESIGFVAICEARMDR